MLESYACIGMDDPGLLTVEEDAENRRKPGIRAHGHERMIMIDQVTPRLRINVAYHFRV